MSRGLRCHGQIKKNEREREVKEQERALPLYKLAIKVEFARMSKKLFILVIGMTALLHKGRCGLP
jgi:hypothetical protein